MVCSNKDTSFLFICYSGNGVTNNIYVEDFWHFLLHSLPFLSPLLFFLSHLEQECFPFSHFAISPKLFYLMLPSSCLSFPNSSCSTQTPTIEHYLLLTSKHILCILKRQTEKCSTSPLSKKTQMVFARSKNFTIDLMAE